MKEDKVSLALTPEGESFLQPLLDIFFTKEWGDGANRPVCLQCASVDFSGPLIEAYVLSPDMQHTTRIWLRHSFVALAVDFSKAPAVGFHAER